MRTYDVRFWIRHRNVSWLSALCSSLLPFPSIKNNSVLHLLTGPSWTIQHDNKITTKHWDQQCQHFMSLDMPLKWHIGYNNYKELLIVSHIWIDLKLDFCVLRTSRTMWVGRWQPGWASDSSHRSGRAWSKLSKVWWYSVHSEHTGLSQDCFFVPVKMSEAGQSGPHCSHHSSVPFVSLKVEHQKRNSFPWIEWEKLLVTGDKKVL